MFNRMRATVSALATFSSWCQSTNDRQSGILCTPIRNLPFLLIFRLIQAVRAIPATAGGSVDSKEGAANRGESHLSNHSKQRNNNFTQLSQIKLACHVLFFFGVQFIPTFFSPVGFDRVGEWFRWSRWRRSSSESTLRSSDAATLCKYCRTATRYIIFSVLCMFFPKRTVFRFHFFQSSFVKLTP